MIFVSERAFPRTRSREHTQTFSLSFPTAFYNINVSTIWNVFGNFSHNTPEAVSQHYFEHYNYSVGESIVETIGIKRNTCNID